MEDCFTNCLASLSLFPVRLGLLLSVYVTELDFNDCLSSNVLAKFPARPCRIEISLSSLLIRKAVGHLQNAAALLAK